MTAGEDEKADVSHFTRARLDAVQEFAELISDDGTRKHIGCVMGLGDGWVEVSMPEALNLPTEISLRFLPSKKLFACARCQEHSIVQDLCIVRHK